MSRPCPTLVPRACGTGKLLISLEIRQIPRGSSQENLPAASHCDTGAGESASIREKRAIHQGGRLRASLSKIAPPAQCRGRDSVAETGRLRQGFSFGSYPVRSAVRTPSPVLLVPWREGKPNDGIRRIRRIRIRIRYERRNAGKARNKAENDIRVHPWMKILPLSTRREGAGGSGVRGCRSG